MVCWVDFVVCVTPRHQQKNTFLDVDVDIWSKEDGLCNSGRVSQGGFIHLNLTDDSQMVLTTLMTHPGVNDPQVFNSKSSLHVAPRYSIQ